MNEKLLLFFVDIIYWNSLFGKSVHEWRIRYTFQ